MKYGVRDWEEISHEEVLRKYGRGIEKTVFRLPNGMETDFYLNSGHDSVACLALTEDRQVILVRQFRPGPKRILLELPGGGLADGETPTQAMERELLEETGYRGNVKFVTRVLPSAYATYGKNACVATDCTKVGEPKTEDNGEELEVVLVSLDEFRQRIRSGQLTDVEMGYLGLDALGLL